MDILPVTMPYLPQLSEYTKLLQQIWNSRILTHNGPLVLEFEKLLAENVGFHNPVAVTNGTIAIQIAIRALGLSGEIITTPFTWVASISAIKWEGCLPIFCDIDAQTLNMDYSKIEALITEKTQAIMPVHVFGNPCEVDKIERLAGKHGLKVIYDAAHAVGSVYQGQSLLNYGDVSATSFHATKIINTAEGGACVTSNHELAEKIRRIRFFGYDAKKDIVEDGFNGKMTEIHAALGILSLISFNSILEDRRFKYGIYKEFLADIPELSFQVIKLGSTNHSYFPVIFPSEEVTIKVIRALEEEGIFPRRYFYPSVNSYSKVVTYQSCPISESISKRILCLPLYYDIKEEDILKVCRIVKSTMVNSPNNS